MDYESLLDDLESQFDAELRREIAAHGADLAESEAAHVTLDERLACTLGQRISLLTDGGRALSGRVTSVGQGYIILDEGYGIQALIRSASLVAISPLPPSGGGVETRRVTLTRIFRALARQGTTVRILVRSGDIVGRMVRIGADHCDIRIDAAQPSSALPGGLSVHASRIVTVPIAAIDVVRAR